MRYRGVGIIFQRIIIVKIRILLIWMILWKKWFRSLSWGRIWSSPRILGWYRILVIGVEKVGWYLKWVLFLEILGTDPRENWSLLKFYFDADIGIDLINSGWGRPMTPFFWTLRISRELWVMVKFWDDIRCPHEKLSRYGYPQVDLGKKNFFGLKFFFPKYFRNFFILLLNGELRRNFFFFEILINRDVS